jgi:predicted ester cyclase
MLHNLKQVLKLFAVTACSLLASPQLSADTSGLVQPKKVTLDKSLTKAEAQKMIQAAQLFYTFWNTGEEKYLQEAVSSKFIDQTLPPGRPQGPLGPLFASKNFRKAVPDLSCSIEELIIAQDKLVARLIFSGHHEGEFLGQKPTGKRIEFNATDILKIQDGKITDNWHIEDNLTLFQQLGVVSF